MMDAATTEGIDMAAPVTRISQLEIALLGFVRKEPIHAYEIYLRLNTSEPLGQVWHLKQGHLYALLAKLEDAGYIVSHMELQGASPPRRMLVLTDAGWDLFEKWLTEPVLRGRDLRQLFFAKLFFASREGSGRVSVLTDRQRAACQDRIADLQERIAALTDDRQYERLLYAFRVNEMQATLVWLDECEALLVAAEA